MEKPINFQKQQFLEEKEWKETKLLVKELTNIKDHTIQKAA